MIKTRLLINVNQLVISIVLVIILSAGFLQLYKYELPCALCVMQRIGFLLGCFGLLLNLVYGLKPSNYAIAILGFLYVAIVSGSQVLRHIIPGSPIYGEAFLGHALYVWAFIAAFALILACVFLLLFDKQFEQETTITKSKLTTILASTLLIVTFLNLASTFLECGFDNCLSDPTEYKYRFW